MTTYIPSPVDKNISFIGVRGNLLTETLDSDPIITFITEGISVPYVPTTELRWSGHMKRLVLKDYTEKCLIIFTNSHVNDDYKLFLFINNSATSSDTLLAEAARLAQSRWKVKREFRSMVSKSETESFIGPEWIVMMSGTAEVIFSRKIF